MTKKAYKETLVKIDGIGRAYRDSKRRMDLCEMEHTVQNNLRQYHNDVTYVRHIDRLLKDCDENTRFIIRNEYLCNNAANWYRGYYSPSAYYRRKKIAVMQFDRILDC